MVNETAERYNKILEALRTSSDPVSGESLAAILNISRTAVWKIISRLKQQGYLIESTHAGYRMLSSTDRPVPWELGVNPGLVEYHNELDSTMHKAESLLKAGCSNGTVVIAGSQTDGRNRDGGSWRSPDGGLYLTRIRTIPFPALYAGLYTVAMSVSIAELLRNDYGINARVDWPGSIECEKGKLGGLLMSFTGDSDTINSAALGIGLNTGSPQYLPDNAASISEISGRAVSVKELTAILLDKIGEADKHFPAPENLSFYSEYLKQTGCGVSADIPGRGRKSGIITGLHESGSLILDTGEYGREYIFTGTGIIYE